jgi:nicotinate-nucleotide adenylyltransferase
VEEELGGESRTLRTLEHLRDTRPDWSMRLLMGADLLLEAPRWFRFDAIREIAPPLVVGRVGVEAPGAPPPVLPAISSTDVRTKVAAGKWEELAQLVPRDVLALIRARKLYA